MTEQIRIAYVGVNIPGGFEVHFDRPLHTNGSDYFIYKTRWVHNQKRDGEDELTSIIADALFEMHTGVSSINVRSYVLAINTSIAADNDLIIKIMETLIEEMGFTIVKVDQRKR